MKQTKGLVFFDTNILIYADDASSPAKQARAISLFADHHRRNASVVYGTSQATGLFSPDDTSQKYEGIPARSVIAQIRAD